MLITVIRTIILYVFIIVAMRILGKRQIGELQPEELVVTILLSEVVAIPMENTEIPLIDTLIPLLLLIGFEIVVSFLSMKSLRLRSVLQGNALIVIRNGAIDQKQMKRLRFTIDDLFEDLRKKDIFDIADVAYAVIETDGSLSVLRRNEKSPPTKQEIGIPIPPDALQCIVINDGRIVQNNFKECGMDFQKLRQILSVEKIEVKDVMLMTMDKNGKSTIVRKEL